MRLLLVEVRNQYKLINILLHWKEGGVVEWVVSVSRRVIFGCVERDLVNEGIDLYDILLIKR